MPTWETDNLFVGTAWYYARYRPDYPEEVISLLVRRFSLDKESRVIDLGCGTGQIALRLAPGVCEIVAVDPQNEMLREGKVLAVQKGINNIKWIKGESGKLTTLAPEIGDIDLTVIARAFHWMDREQTLHDLYSMTKTGGGVAVIQDNGPRDNPASNPWKVIIDDIVKYWLGDVRKAGTKGTYAHPQKRFEALLEESPFHYLEIISIKTNRAWTIDQIIGYLYSTSSSSLPVLGDKKERFEADLRRQLAALGTDSFQEEVITNVMMVWK